MVQRTIAAASIAMGLAGCASFNAGDPELAARLKRFAPVDGKTSLYVCRESAWSNGAVSAKAIVDGVDIGALAPNTFVHTVLDAGGHSLALDRDIGHGLTGRLAFTTRPSEVLVLWAGVTGNGFGVLTVDFFASQDEARSCVAHATYSVVAR